MQVQQETFLISSKEKNTLIVLLHTDNMSMRNLGFERNDSKKIFENNCYRIHRFLLLLINILLKSDII